MQVVVWSAFIRGSGVQTNVQKWENSFGVRIPRGFAEEGDWQLVLRSASQLRMAVWS
jgi:antitoxin component of MazEF toxin-antitoxin module